MYRCYEIRRDLEHEDDEYEAGIEDCVYMFRTCIDVVLSRDPVELLRVTDVKEIIEESTPAVPTETLVEEFRIAPSPRQEEILKFLMSISLDKTQSEIVQQNAFTFLERLSPLIHNTVRLNLAKHFQEKVSRSTLDRRLGRVAFAMGLLSFLKRSQVVDFFESIYMRMKSVGTNWGSHGKHGDVIRSFTEVGAFISCPEKPKQEILRYLVLTYLGTPGGTTSYGNFREVYYSNTAAPLIREIVSVDRDLIRQELQALQNDKVVKERCSNQHIARRLEDLLDIVEGNSC